MRSIETPDGPMDVIVAEPDAPARRGVVVVQEAFGLTPHLHDVCGRFAAAGYLAVAPALFHRTGSPVLGYDQLDQVAPHFLAIEPAGLSADLHAALDLLADAGIDPPRRAVVGFCMGGTIAMWAAATFDLGAAVTFYGGGIAAGRFGLPSLVELAPTIRAPWQGHYGDEDTGIPVEQVEQLRSAFDHSAVPTELYRYPGAGHGFHCDDRSAHHPPSAALAWQRTLAFLSTHLVG